MTGQTLSAAEGFSQFWQSLQEPQPKHGRKEIAALMNYARRQAKGDWYVYSDCKQRLDELNISIKQYQRAHRSLINILAV